MRVPLTGLPLTALWKFNRAGDYRQLAREPPFTSPPSRRLHRIQDSGEAHPAASRLIGDREIVRTQVSETLSRDGVTFMAGQRASTTTSLRHSTEPAVLPAEIADMRSQREWLTHGLAHLEGECMGIRRVRLDDNL